jgi:hypothetical protein
MPVSYEDLLPILQPDSPAMASPAWAVAQTERADAPTTGVRMLMIAVLEEGIQTYLTDRGRAFAEAETWLLSPARRSPFSFQVLCETLNLNAHAVRRELMRKRAHADAQKQGLGRIRRYNRQSNIVELRRPRKPLSKRKASRSGEQRPVVRRAGHEAQAAARAV